MAQALVKVAGAKALRRSLKAAGDDMSDLKTAHAEAAAIAAHAAAARAPVGPTGKLRASIRAAGTTTAGIIRAGRKRIPYAGPIHFGYRSRNIAANPFVTEAAQATEPDWTAHYLDQINTIINQIEGHDHA